MVTKDFFEEKLDSKLIYHGKILSLLVDSVRLPSGKEATREVIKHNGGVTIIAQPESSKVILVKQFRYSVRKVLFELPAGRLNENEDPVNGAKRELKEECGFKAGAWESLGVVYPAPGYSSEVLYFFKATSLIEEEPTPDADENIEVKIIDLKQAWKMVKDGEIVDAKTIAGLSMVMY